MKAVLFPTGDTETLALLRHRSKLEPYYHFTTADYNTVHSLINKQHFYQLLEKYQIPHPRTFFPKDEQDAKTVSTQLSYPCIIKPVYTTYFRLEFHTKLFVASSPDELLSLFKKAHEKKHEMMLQEIIPGGADTMFGYNAYYDRTCVPHGMFMYQRIREWPLGFGNGCCIQQAQEPLLEQITTSLMQKLGYYGIVDAEFKRDPRDGTFHFIEINPRIWMQNSFPSRFGINHPLLAYLDAIGKPLDDQPPHNPDKNIKWVYLLEDMQSAHANITSGELSLRTWIHTYNLRNEYALFTWDDPLPFVVLGCRSIPTFLSTLLRRTSQI
jgi:predicted ATP-grasp superfamily ATP-dependent carboligase